VAAGLSVASAVECVGLKEGGGSRRIEREEEMRRICHIIIHTMSHHHTYYVTSSLRGRRRCEGEMESEGRVGGDVYICRENTHRHRQDTDRQTQTQTHAHLQKAIKRWGIQTHTQITSRPTTLRLDIIVRLRAADVSKETRIHGKSDLPMRQKRPTPTGIPVDLPAQFYDVSRAQTCP
jgi:hypothetical protein